MPGLRIAVFALALFGTVMVAGEASAAMPLTGLEPAVRQVSIVQDVRCCWGRGYWRGRGYWGRARFYGRPYWGRPFVYGRPYWGRPYWGRPYWYGCRWGRCWW